MSATATEKQQQQKIKGGPFSIVVLNIIFSYAAESACDAHFRLALTCQNWKETVYFYGSGMWQQLIYRRFPSVVENINERESQQHNNTSSTISFSRWCRQSYERRVNSHQEHFIPIENCDLAFKCPVLQEHIRVLENEVHPENGLPISFCDVCEKKIYPVTSYDQLGKAADEGRCVLLVPGSKTMNEFYDGAKRIGDEISKKLEKQKSSAADSASASSKPIPIPRRTHRTFNVALVTSHEPDKSPEVCAGDAKDMTSEMLFSIAQQLGEKFFKGRFLSRNYFVCEDNAGTVKSSVHVVYVPKAPEKVSQISAKTANHPMIGDNAPLGQNNFPSNGGYNQICIVDDDACRWFEAVSSYKNQNSLINALVSCGAGQENYKTVNDPFCKKNCKTKQQKRDYLVGAIVETVKLEERRANVRHHMMRGKPARRPVNPIRKLPIGNVNLRNTSNNNNNSSSCSDSD